MKLSTRTDAIMGSAPTVNRSLGPARISPSKPVSQGSSPQVEALHHEGQADDQKRVRAQPTMSPPAVDGVSEKSQGVDSAGKGRNAALKDQGRLPS